jgi:hypothetical protein
LGAPSWGNKQCFKKSGLAFYANFIAATSGHSTPRLIGNKTMKVCMTKTLRFWVDCDYEDTDGTGAKAELIASILRGYEEVGEAMRYVRADGRIGWKATPRMLSRLADAEQEARDDLADRP